MTRRRLFMLLLPLTSLLWTIPPPAGCQKEIKVGFISLRKISDESLKRKAYLGEVRKWAEPKRAELQAIRKEIEDLETAKALSGPEQAKKEEERIRQKQMELLRLRTEFQQEMAKRDAAYGEEILKDIAEAVKEIAEEKGYTWVLVDEVLVYKDESADLTFQTLIRVNEKYIKAHPKAPTELDENASSSAPPEGEPGLSASAEDALIREVTENGVRSRFTIKEIQPRRSSESGSITMKGEGGRVRFVPQYPKDMKGGAGGVIGAPMGNQSVWRFVGEVALSGYTFTGLNENRPLSFILLEEIGLVHLYGRGSVTLPDGQNVAIEEEKASSNAETGTKGE